MDNGINLLKKLLSWGNVVEDLKMEFGRQNPGLDSVGLTKSSD